MSFPLEFTPRKFVVHPESGMMIIIETDHNAYTDDTKTQRKIQMAEEMREAAGEDEQELANEMAEAFLTENLPESGLHLNHIQYFKDNFLICFCTICQNTYCYKYQG